MARCEFATSGSGGGQSFRVYYLNREVPQPMGKAATDIQTPVNYLSVTSMKRRPVGRKWQPLVCYMAKAGPKLPWDLLSFVFMWSIWLQLDNKCQSI
jgi:hypothetical protein